MSFVLSPGQSDALGAIERWLKTRDRPFFYLAGYAGTGKTSIARKLVEGKRAVFAAYTGKAADVMAQRGCVGATTIHRLIYKPTGFDGDPAVKALRAEVSRLAGADAVDRNALDAALGKLAVLRANAKGMGFVLDTENPEIRACDIIVIDEVSMVSEQIMSDLMAFGKPILVLGDVGQLPPVKAAGYFQNRTPDVLLTEVHRQALDSGVLQIATMIREGRRPALGFYGAEHSWVVSRKIPDFESFRGADQLICGYNKTRDAINRMMRGKEAPMLPVAGDKLVCLRNNHDAGFYNGSTMVATSDAWREGSRAFVFVERDGVRERVRMDLAAIAGAGAGNDYKAISLDYAWALTCHKAQGSQWGKVMVIDESDVAREHARAWAYTATSRASHQLVLALS